MTIEERLELERLAENARQNYCKASEQSCSLVLKANFLGEYVAYKTVIETLEKHEQGGQIIWQAEN